MAITKNELGRICSYYDEDNKRMYGRIVIALSWPREMGFACVVAAGLHEEKGTNQKPFYVLAEIDANNLNDLLRRCLDLHDTYKAEEIYAYKDVTYKRLLAQWNNNRGSQPTMYTSAPPYTDTANIEYHINLIKSKLSPDKHLFFFEGSKLPGCLASVPSSEVRDATEDKYSEVAALGYAVAGLTSWSGGGFRQESYVTDYDIFDL